MDHVTDEDIVILQKQDMNTLAKWWNVLNAWGWPEELANIESPKDWTLHGRRSQLINWIIERIGLRECLREANRLDMSDDEFNDFWRGCYEGNTEARERYDSYISDRITGNGT